MGHGIGDTPMERTVLCYLEGRGNQWEGICLDFDIAVQGGSQEEVKELLQAAITDYLNYVFTLPESERPQLLNRKAPLVDRLRFAYHALRVALFSGRGGDKARHEYLLPCAA